MVQYSCMIRKRASKKSILRLGIVVWFMLLFCLGLLHGSSVFAAQCGGANTSIINCDNEEGGVFHILYFVINIFSIGVGILGVIGISVAGVQVLTANGNTEQVKKARNRIWQIVLGLVVYVGLFAIIQWLLPGGLLNSHQNLQNSGSTSQIEGQNQNQQGAGNTSNGGSGGGSSGSGGGGNPNSGQSGSNNTNNNSSSQKPKAQRISNIAWKLAKGKIDYASVAKATGYFIYMKENCLKMGGGDCRRGKAGYRTFCSGFVYNVVRYSGADPNYPMKLTGNQLKYANKSSRWQNVTSKVKGRTAKLKPGDVLIRDGHTLIITANSKGQLFTAQAAVGMFEPQINKIANRTTLDGIAGDLSRYQVFRIVE